MSELTIKTNNHPRDLICFYDLSEKEQEDLDYIEEQERCSLRIVRYRGHAYDVGDFVRITSTPAGFNHYAPEGSPLLDWDGIATDSFFSAVVVRYVPDTDYEQVVVGLAFS